MNDAIMVLRAGARLVLSVGVSCVAAVSVLVAEEQARPSIGVPKWISGDTSAAEKPAPVLERTFSLPARPGSAVLEIAVGGWCEVSVNGSKVGEDVLNPVTGQPDRRLPLVRFDLTGLLRQGENSISVLLGNGWFNMFTLCTCRAADPRQPDHRRQAFPGHRRGMARVRFAGSVQRPQERRVV